MNDDPTKPLTVNEEEKQVKNRPGQFQPGQSGNPNGRPPKGHSITETIREMMDEKPEIKKALGSKIFQMALQGDMVAIKTIWNYLDGLPKASQEVSGSLEIVTRRSPTETE